MGADFCCKQCCGFIVFEGSFADVLFLDSFADLSFLVDVLRIFCF